jgi:hypothetical protein
MTQLPQVSVTYLLLAIGVLSQWTTRQAPHLDAGKQQQASHSLPRL